MSDTSQGFTRVVNWGQALHLEAVVADGGLSSAVDHIHAVVGKSYGTRNTYKKLFSMQDVPTSEKERERAWLLLVALGQDPAEWGLGDVTFPLGFDLDSLQNLLSDQGSNESGWFSRVPVAA